jgi:predicted dehydrogenase
MNASAAKSGVTGRVPVSSPQSPVRIGILGAARIVPSALIAPAKWVPEVRVAAIAARDPARAKAFAAQHNIPRVHATYDDLLADPEIDAVFNPLPNSLHCPWTIRALEAGKHVLCEKPFAANAAEAEQMAAAAERTGLVLMEAFHYRYHPLAARMIEIATNGTLGRVKHIETNMCVPLPLPGNIRYRYDLAGGATMDTGAYGVHMLRHLAGAEPTVTHAEALLSSPRVDRRMRADFTFADGRTGRMTCSLFSATLLKISARVVGDLGELYVFNPIVPQLYHRLPGRTAEGKKSEMVPGRATYEHQLRAFAKSVLTGAPVLTSAQDAILNMRVIDRIYEKAGLTPRGAP